MGKGEEDYVYGGAFKPGNEGVDAVCCVSSIDSDVWRKFVWMYFEAKF